MDDPAVCQERPIGARKDMKARLAALALQGVDAVAGPRNRDYGPPKDDMDAVAMMWTAYLRKRGLLPSGATLEAFDVPLLLDCVKICRLATSPGHADSIVDLIGWPLVYAECLSEAGDEGTTIAP